MSFKRSTLSLVYLGDVEIGLLEKFTDDQHDRGRSITSDVILGRCRTSDQRRSWMLNLLDDRNRCAMTHGDQYLAYEPFRVEACGHPW